MNIDLIKIKREFEQKRNNAIKENEINKAKIFESNPELLEIEDNIRSLGIEASKKAIKNQGDSSDLIKQLEALKKKKQAILSKKGLSLSPKFECEKCEDTGYITNDYITTMCSCLKQRIINEYYNNSNLKNLNCQTFENFDISLFSGDTDSQKYKSNISPKENITKIKNKSLEFVENFENPDTKNLLFIGSAGTGKTFLSSCIANEIIKKGYTVLYQTAPILMDSIFKYKYDDDKTAKELYENLYNVDLLIIDDLGAESSSSAKYAELFSIINSRMLNSKTKTIISSNLSWDKIIKNYDDRITSRIIGNYNICLFFGDDIRLKKI